MRQKNFFSAKPLFLVSSDGTQRQTGESGQFHSGPCYRGTWSTDKNPKIQGEKQTSDGDESHEHER